MTELEQLIRRQIETSGPMDLHDFMELTLGHPQFGYYQKQTALGAAGDFITAPEISQMFGELVGLWCVDCWAKLGSPARFHLIEFGPGKGTLMKDALRSASLVPEFIEAATVTLIESSDRLTAIQKEALSKHEVNWEKSLPDFDDDLPLIILGNEFLDALPIRQYQWQDEKWQERQVALSDGELAFTLSPSQNTMDFPEDPETGDIFEICPAAREVIGELSKLISSKRGAALFVDYGPANTDFGDSFQAVKRHQFANPLADPGQQDLTAHVDFETLSNIASDNNCNTAPIETQGRFLERLGIEARVMMLSRQANETQKEKLASDHRRLVSSEHMGTLFKAFSFHNGMLAPPAGFGEAS